MKPRITIVTFGVDDLERSLEFDRDGLGLQTEAASSAGSFEHGEVAFFDLETELKLALWPRATSLTIEGSPSNHPARQISSSPTMSTANRKWTRLWNRRSGQARG